MKKYKILARHKDWVSGATITESVNEYNEYNDSQKKDNQLSYRRFTATIDGWNNWKIFEGHLVPDIVNIVINKVKEIRRRIQLGDETVFNKSENIFITNKRK